MTTHTSGPPFATCGEFCQWIIDGHDVFTRDRLADRNAILSTPLVRIRDLWKQCRRAIRIDDCPHCWAERQKMIWKELK